MRGIMNTHVRFEAATRNIGIMSRLNWPGLAIVIFLHAALLYSLWHYRILPPPTEATTLFVELLKEPPKSEPPKPVLPKPRPRPTKLEKPVPIPPPQQLAVQTPAVSPSDSVAPPPAPPAPPSKPAGPVMLSGELAITCPERTPPSYPAFSRRLGEEGKAVLRVELDETGQVDHATVQTSSGYTRLDEAALSAVKHWHCPPARRDGVAVRAVAIQPFNFVLEGR